MHVHVRVLPEFHVLVNLARENISLVVAAIDVIVVATHAVPVLSSTSVPSLKFHSFHTTRALP